jgi:hypothetical protein
MVIEYTSSVITLKHYSDSCHSLMGRVLRVDGPEKNRILRSSVEVNQMSGIILRSFLGSDSSRVGASREAGCSQQNENQLQQSRGDGSACVWLGLIAVASCLTLAGCGGVTVNGANGSSGSFTATPNDVEFGSVGVGTSGTSQVSLVNSSSTAVVISQLAVTGNSYFKANSDNTLPFTIAPGSTTVLQVAYDPQLVEEDTAQLNITSNSVLTPSATVKLHGTGSKGSGNPAPTPPTISLLSCASGTVTGAGTDACTVTLSAAAPSGGTSVSLASNNAAVTVPATVTVAANATSAGFKATVSAVSSTQSVTLTATAGGASKTFAMQLAVPAPTVPTLSINATTVSFGNVALNVPSTQSVTLSSTGTAPVTVSAVTASGTGFTVTGATFPLTLNSGQTATLSVQFDPAATGASSGQLTVTSNSSTNTKAVVKLTGTGVPLEIALNWEAPSGSAVAGYNVYRATSGNSSYKKLNASIDASPTFTDGTIQIKTTYDYYVTSVDSSGVESPPSNTATVAVP